MTLVAALLAAAGAAIAWPPSARDRLRGATAAPVRARHGPSGVPDRPGPLGRGRVRAGPGPRSLAAAAALGVGTALLVGSAVGLVAGLAVAAGAAVGLSRLEPAEAQARRERLAGTVPLLTDLLAASLSAGCPVERALSAVTEVLGPPLADVLAPVQRALDLGADPGSAWAGLEHGPLAPLARTLGRCARTGASPATALGELADDLRASEAARATARGRSTAARAAAPLGACFLPAFVLGGVVPLVAGLVGPLLG